MHIGGRRIQSCLHVENVCPFKHVSVTERECMCVCVCVHASMHSCMFACIQEGGRYNHVYRLKMCAHSKILLGVQDSLVLNSSE